MKSVVSETRAGKRIIAAACAAALLSLFAACDNSLPTPSGPTGEVTGDPVSPSPSASVSPFPSESASPSGDDVVVTPEITVEENFVSDTLSNDDGDILVTYASALPRLADNGSPGAAVINGFYNDVQADFTYYARTELSDVAKANLEAFHELGIPYTPCSASQNYTVRYSKNDYISIYRSITAYMGSNRVDETAAADTFTLSDGKRVDISAFFKEGEDYTALIHALIAREIDNQGGENAGYYESYVTLVKEYFDPSNFYLTEEGIAFIYPPITIAPSMLGVCVFEIPHAEFEGMIEKELWQ